MITIYTTPLWFEDIERLVIQKETIEENTIYYCPTAKRRVCAYGREGLMWHMTLGEAKAYMERNKAEEIERLEKRMLKLKQTSITINNKQ